MRGGGTRGTVDFTDRCVGMFWPVHLLELVFVSPVLWVPFHACSLDIQPPAHKRFSPARRGRVQVDEPQDALAARAPSGWGH